MPVWEMKAGRRKLGHAWRLREPALEDARSAGGGSRERGGKKALPTGAPGKQRKIRGSGRRGPPSEKKEEEKEKGNGATRRIVCVREKRERDNDQKK